tara:strand:- start:2290 stop:2715 length:426 start_codon:yes stop_codon:yes gene_type:complete
MKLKIKTNFDFGKLSSQLDKITTKYLAGFVVEAAKGSKDNIDKGLRKLKKSTVRIRRWRQQPPSPPLKASGALYKSIKGNNQSLEMLDYGKLHHDGFTTSQKSLIKKQIKIEPRPFIATTAKNRDKIDKEFMININKALKK